MSCLRSSFLVLRFSSVVRHQFATGSKTRTPSHDTRCSQQCSEYPRVRVRRAPGREARGGLEAGARWLEDAWTAASLWSVSILVGLASCGRGDRVASCSCSPRSPAQLPAELVHLMQLPDSPIRGSRISIRESRSSDFRLSGSCGRYAIGCLERVGERCLRGPTGRSNALVMSHERPGSVLDYRVHMLIMPYVFVLHSIGGLIPGQYSYNTVSRSYYARYPMAVCRTAIGQYTHPRSLQHHWLLCTRTSAGATNRLAIGSTEQNPDHSLRSADSCNKSTRVLGMCIVHAVFRIAW